MTASAPGPVTADDVEHVAADAVGALARATDLDWTRPATGLDWTCWETVEHVSDDFFAYAGQLASPTPPLQGYVPFGYEARRPGGPALTVWVDPADGVGGQLQVLSASAGLLAAQVRTRGPDVRANHPYGASDPAGFAAMGVVEALLHLWDVAGPLGLEWTPDDDLCTRVRHRLFPDAPTDQPAWPTLLWATGRGDLPGRERVDDWRWDSSVRD